MAARGRTPTVAQARNGVGSRPVGRGLETAGPAGAGAVREGVGEIQRARMLAATTELAAELGASSVSVAAIVGRSGVSRRTFYQVFADVRECLLAALEESLEQARAYAREAYDPSDAWLVRTRLALHALLCFLEDQPSRARLLIVEAPVADQRVLERRAQVLDELIEAVDGGRARSGHNAVLTPLTAEGVVGSALAVVHARLVRDGARDGPSLVELTNPLMGTIALPYLGAAAARKELERPLPKRTRPPARPFEGANRLNGLPMRVTYRTMRALRVIAAQPGASNRRIGEAAGMSDQGQVSKLLQRLERLGLAVNTEAGQERGMANAWELTPAGVEIERVTGHSWEPGG